MKAWRSRAEDVLSAPGLVTWVLSGALAGFYGWARFIGAFRTEALVYGRWLAGIIPYDPGNPTAISLYDTAVPFHGLVALLLKAGLSDIAITQLTCAINVAVYAQATALIIYVLSRNVPAAVLIGVVQAACAGYLQGSDYPIVIVNNEKLLGSLGFGLQLQIFGLIGLGRLGPACGLVAALSLVHPVFAAFNAGLLVAARLLSGFGRGRHPWPVVVGLTMVIAAWWWLKASRPEVIQLPPPDEAMVRAYFDLWDGHRNIPVTRYSLLNMIYSLAGMGLAVVVWLRADIRLRPMVGSIALAALAGILLWAGFHALRPWLPLAILIPIPNRMMNVSEAVVFPLVVGVLLSLRPRSLVWTALAMLAVVMIATGIALDRGILVLGQRHYLYAKAVEKLALLAVLVPLALSLLRGGRWLERDGIPWNIAVRRRIPALAAWPLVALLVAGGGWGTRSGDLFGPWDAAMDRLAKSGGVVLAFENINLTKAPFRNAELFSFASFDVLPYTTRLIPVVAKIMEDVFGGDIFHPPPANVHDGAYNQVDMAMIERRTLAEWQELGARYGFHFVVTYPQYSLNLKKVFRLQLIDVYYIPPPK